MSERTEIGRSDEEHPSPLADGLDAERDGQVGLAGADRPGEDHVLRSVKPATASELCHLRCGHAALVRGEVEGVQGLHLREAGFALSVPHG